MENPNRISIRISEQDLKELKDKASRLNLTVSEYIRMQAVQEIDQVLYDPEVRDAVFECLALLRETGRYIHELSRGTGQEKQMEDLNGQLSAIVDTLRKRLEQEGKNNGNHKTDED